MRFISQGMLCPSLDCDLEAFCQDSAYYRLGFGGNSEEKGHFIYIFVLVYQAVTAVTIIQREPACSIVLPQ